MREIGLHRAMTPDDHSAEPSDTELGIIARGSRPEWQAAAALHAWLSGARRSRMAPFKRLAPPQNSRRLGPT